MYLPCENFAKHILPILRACLAKELIEKYSYTQVDAATKLGTTQAAISQYLHLKRGCKMIDLSTETMPEIKSAIIEIAEHMTTNEITHDKIRLEICKLCKLIQLRMVNSNTNDT